MSDDGLLVDDAGEIVLQSIAISVANPQDGLRIDDDAHVPDACCITIYVQARLCTDGSLVDLWFPLNIDSPYGIETSFDAHTSAPFFFKITGGGDTVYYVNDDLSCTPGTLAGDVTEAKACGNCSNCVASDRPRSLNISASSIEIYLHVFIPPSGSRAVRIDSDVTSIPDVCMCYVEDCVWFHIERDIGTATAQLDADASRGLAAETRTLALDAVYVVARQGTGISGAVSTFASIYLIARDTGTYVAPNAPVELGPLFVFVGRAFYDDCFDTPTFANQIIDYGPFPSDLGITSPAFPPAYILSSFYCDYPCGWASVGCGTWCAANLPSETLLFAFGSGNQYFIGRSGDVTVSPSADLCSWTPQWRVTITGTIPSCDGANQKGHSTIDGAYDDNGVDNSGFALAVHYNIGPVDHVDVYAGSDCTGGITGTAGGDYEIVLALQVITPILSIFEVTVIRVGDASLLWYARLEFNPNETELVCGYPNNIAILSNSVVFGPLRYADGAAFLELQNTP